MAAYSEFVPCPQSGRSNPRSRKGCWTCRGKKVKCDEQHPECRRCVRLGLACDYRPRIRFADKTLHSPTSSRPVLVDAGGSRSLSCKPGQNKDVLSVSESSRRPLVEMDSSVWVGQPETASPRISQTPLHPIPSLKTVGACGLSLGHEEHEAIRYFKDIFAPLYHTKNPEYSVFAILLNIARDDALVMHMVLAISTRDIDFRQNRFRLVEDGQSYSPGESQTANSEAYSRGIHHYAAALRMMADIISHGETEPDTVDLDSVVSALLLMIMYEQIHGDAKCTGLTNHLAGTSHIIKQYCSRVLRALPATPVSTESQKRRPYALTKTAPLDSARGLSQYSARLLARICLMDIMAASYGMGGQITGTLYKMLSLESDVQATPPLGPIEAFELLERYAYPLYRTVWGDLYPQSEMLDDIENRNVFDLFGACGQLRYLNSQLAKLLSCGNLNDTEGPMASIQAAIDKTSQRFTEILEVAASLSVETDNTHRLVANIRWIVPAYHATVLEFLRLKKGTCYGLELDDIQRAGLRSIMNLAVQAYRHDGDVAMLRIARPLFIVALETDDVLHREWVLERFQGLRQFGRHFERARDFITDLIKLQQSSGQRVNVRDVIESGKSSHCVYIF